MFWQGANDWRQIWSLGNEASSGFDLYPPSDFNLQTFKKVLSASFKKWKAGEKSEAACKNIYQNVSEVKWIAYFYVK